MRSLFRNLGWIFKGVKVYALIGKSGTGKSFRARLVADKYGIPLIVDDGLLIKGEKILAGESAKKEATYLGAVKVALFQKESHRRAVIQALRKEEFNKILILATSKKMADKIARTLDLPPVHKYITIEEVATPEEIEIARHYRRTQGKHVIPVPSLEVKRTYPQILADSLRLFIKRGFGFFKKEQVVEKAVVRPTFAQKGTVTISESALTELILHCLSEYDPDLRLLRAQITTEGGAYHITIFLSVPFGKELASPLHELHRYIITNLERYTGIIVEELHMVVDKITKPVEG
ncbi:hypothetical protein Spith_0403 [Spirochaeta thermophila DSM 6578]|uniref:Uncharacterized protein n=1 Tax=Winmispira thermophila (strain ATCC 700085 / DSM 6578 / Z-1203) TaxID=869211 RepID=G0GEJ9_WINT7|nr:hypothetical protein [Spirochaeta thermophila]AEJ60687.1 hypothetical protein Spith_0403 [Spirochaeta thermophila DSM 6578]